MKCTIGQADCGLSHGGVSFVSMDSAPTPESVLAGRVSVDYKLDRLPSPELKTDLPEKERGNLLRVLEKFAELGADYDNAGLVCSMLAGKTIQQIARERGETPQNVHARWTRIINSDSVWLALSNGMIGRGRGRKPKVSRIKQMELF